VNLTFRQLAVAATAEQKWLLNSAAILRRPLRHTVKEARWWGLVRHLSGALSLPLSTAAAVATRAMDGPARGLAVAEDATGTIKLEVDLHRYASIFLGNLSYALVHAGSKRRGRPPRLNKGGDAIEMARKYGVDIGLVESSLDRSPAERLAMAEANARFVREMRAALR
jgi:hypothetical protein